MSGDAITAIILTGVYAFFLYVGIMVNRHRS